MGTVVLFPQDCLPISESRQGSSFSDEFDGPCVSPDSAFQPPILYSHQSRSSYAPYDVAGSMYPYGVRSSIGLNSLHREFDQRKPKSKGPGDPNEDDTNSPILGLNVAALQQTKSNAFISDLGNHKEMRLTIKDSGFKICNTVNNGLSDRKKITVSNLKNGFYDFKSTKVQGCNSGLHRLASIASTTLDTVMQDDPKEQHHKADNVVRGLPITLARRSCDGRLMLSKKVNQDSEQNHGPLYISGNITAKTVLANQSYRVHKLENHPTRLRRASTDPQLVEHLGHYRKQLLQIPGSDINAITRTSSMPAPERWAGPAYIASPAPSSLPLPKFSFLGQKTPSLHASSTIEQQKGRIAVRKELGYGAKAPEPLRAEAKLDVTFATRSLRRMLKLDIS